MLQITSLYVAFASILSVTIMLQQKNIMINTVLPTFHVTIGTTPTYHQTAYA